MKFSFPIGGPSLLPLTEIPALLANQSANAFPPEQVDDDLGRVDNSSQEVEARARHAALPQQPGLDGFRARAGTPPKLDAVGRRLLQEREWGQRLIDALRKSRLAVTDIAGHPVAYTEQAMSSHFVRTADLIKMLHDAGHEAEIDAEIQVEAELTAQTAALVDTPPAEWPTSLAVATAFKHAVSKKKNPEWLTDLLANARKRPGLSEARQLRSTKRRKVAVWHVPTLACWLVKNKYLGRPACLEVIKSHFPGWYAEALHLIESLPKNAEPRHRWPGINSPH